MNVSLGEHFEALLRRKVESGSYKNAAEVVREGLRLLEQRDERRRVALDALRAKIDRGYRQAVNGEGRDGDEVFEELLDGLDD